MALRRDAATGDGTETGARRDNFGHSCVLSGMRLIVSTLLALALGFLPGSLARAQDMRPAAAATMACHETGDRSMNHHQPGPSDDTQACATACLSHVNAQPAFAPLAAPSLLNLVDAEPFTLTYLGHPRDRDPPEPPPPRR